MKSTSNVSREARSWHTGSNLGHDTRNDQYSCVFVGCHLRRKVFEFAVSHETHNPKVGGSNPPSATRNHSSPISCKCPATIRIDNPARPLLREQRVLSPRISHKEEDREA